MKQEATRLFTSIILSCSLAWPSLGHAECSNAKFGTVDMEELLLNSESGKKSLAPLNELINASKAEAERMQNELQSIRSQAVELAKTPSPANQQVLATLQTRFDNNLADLQRLETEARKRIDQQRFQSLSDFNRLAMPLIQAMAKDQGYTMIFRKQESGLLYSDEANDLTAQLIAHLNSQLNPQPNPQPLLTPDSQIAPQPNTN